jgi:hypothetical protein
MSKIKLSEEAKRFKNSYLIKSDLAKTVEIVKVAMESIRKLQPPPPPLFQKIEGFKVALVAFSELTLLTRLKMSQAFQEINQILKVIDSFNKEDQDRIIRILDGMETIKVGDPDTIMTGDIYVYFDQDKSRAVFHHHKYDDERYELIAKIIKF